ncbi:MAG: lytic transglycosylase domain-containing protein [Rubrivivax sp.]|nr:lytic transglycosylase domain-containing protein [Rubrivivax sp.]
MQVLASKRLSRLGTSTADSARHWARLAWQGVVEIGHNSLAVLGLACIAVVLFFSSDSALRQQIERQALEWLNLRHGVASVQAEGPVDLLSELSEPDAVTRATALKISTLPRQQQLVTQWVSRRYRVAPEPIARLVQEAWVVGKKADLDPLLILSIMAIESSFNPFAQSPVGAQGLMQVMTHVHDDKYESFGGRLAAFDPITNLRVGVQVLTECISRAGGGIEAGLKFYVGAANLPDDGGYAERVMIELGHLRAVASGQNVPLNVPSTRSSTPAPATPAAPPASPAPAPANGTLVVQASSGAPASLPYGGATLPGKPAALSAGQTLMAPALGAPVSANLSVGIPANATVPVAAPAAVLEKPSPGPAPTPAAPQPQAAAPLSIPVVAPAAHPAKAPGAQPAASSPAEPEPRPAKPKTETASVGPDGRVALLGGAVR